MKKTKLDLVYKEVPSLIKGILLSTDGWLVGSSAKMLIEGEVPPKDYDIIVPSRKLFHNTIYYFNQRAKLEVNNYGGFKIRVEGLTIDIWCEKLSHFLGNANSISYLYNHKSRILLSNIK